MSTNDRTPTPTEGQVPATPVETARPAASFSVLSAREPDTLDRDALERRLALTVKFPQTPTAEQAPAVPQGPLTTDLTWSPLAAVIARGIVASWEDKGLGPDALSEVAGVGAVMQNLTPGDLAAIAEDCRRRMPAALPAAPVVPMGKPCTCSQTGQRCRGAAGLGDGWYCTESARAPVAERGGQWHDWNERGLCRACGVNCGSHVVGAPCPGAAPVAPGVLDLCREVLRLDGEATPGPWVREMAQDGEELPDGTGYLGDMYETLNIVRAAGPDNGEEPIADGYRGEDANLIALYRAAAPALARALLSSPAVPRAEERAARIEEAARHLLATLTTETDGYEHTAIPFGWADCFPVFTAADSLRDALKEVPCLSPSAAPAPDETPATASRSATASISGNSSIPTTSATPTTSPATAPATTASPTTSGTRATPSTGESPAVPRGLTEEERREVESTIRRLADYLETATDLLEDDSCCGDDEDDEDEDGDFADARALIGKARNLLDRLTATAEAPHPTNRNREEKTMDQTKPLTYGQIAERIATMTPEQRDMPALWTREDDSGAVYGFWEFEDDQINPSGDGWENVSYVRKGFIEDGMSDEEADAAVKSEPILARKGQPVMSAERPAEAPRTGTEEP